MDDSSSSSGGIQDYLGFFGLDQEPFEADLFIGGAERQALLDQLNHLCEFSASLVAVMGDEGLGKTTLFRALANTLPADQTCQITAELVSSCGHVLTEIARAFDLPSEGGTEGQLLSEIRRYSQSSVEESRALILIDNAELLDAETLVALLSLLQGQEASLRHLHVVLFGSPDLISRLDAIEVSDVLVHDLYVDPLDAVQLESYLGERMSESGFIEGIHTSPFTSQICETFVAASGGNLKEIHVSAKDMLLRASLPKSRRRSLSMPFAHISAVIALATLLLVALYFPDQDNKEDLKIAVPVKESVAAKFAPVIRSAGSKFVEPRNEEASRVGRPDVGQVKSAISRSDVEVKAANPTLDKEKLAAFQALVESEPNLPPETDVKAKTASNIVVKKKVSSSAVKLSRAAEPSRALSPAQELLAWPAQEYTLQVLASGSLSGVKTFVAGQVNKKDLKIISSQRDGKPWHIVFAGRYKTLEEARGAIASLPLRQRKTGPWPRSLGSIQSQLREFSGLN
jgi:DamX protein